MIKDTDFKRIFNVDRKTDRDAELPLLYEFVRDHGPFESILDVGSYGGEYLHQFRALTPVLHACDVTYDPSMEFTDEFHVGNFNEIDFGPGTYDLVTCVSTLEHAGVSTYKGDYRKERMRLFRKLFEMSRRAVWVSFPVGIAYVYPDELAIVPNSTLKVFESHAKEWGKVTQRFLYTQGAQAGHFWIEHNQKSVATKIPYIDYIGNQSICVMEVIK